MGEGKKRDMLRRVADISVVTDEEWMMVSRVDAAGEVLNVCVNLRVAQ